MHQLSPTTSGRWRVGLTVGLVVLLLLPFNSTEAEAWEDETNILCESVPSLAFNGSLANRSVQWQVDLGPRIPGSNASLAFREHLQTTLEPLGWNYTETVHQRHGMNLTNVEARWNGTVHGTGQVVLSAHYDSRNIADWDSNESNRSLPVPGANDGASGAAVLMELARHIPNLGLAHDVVLFWNDAEDQNENFTAGAEAWAENLSTEDIASTHAFVLLDMVGDADLQLRNINPGNDTLKQRIVELAAALGMIEDRLDCNGTLGLDIVQYDIEVGVLDDHYHAHVRNIPSIDVMDPVYGEPKWGTFGTFWHTMQDTPDKVSAESLGMVGRLIELGLRTDAFVNITNQTHVSEVNDSNQRQNEHPTVASKKNILAFDSLIPLFSLAAGAAQTTLRRKNNDSHAR
jgi:glutaminyl-peptide cyclotransferase